jgi:hypothetical protein
VTPCSGPDGFSNHPWLRWIGRFLPYPGDGLQFAIESQARFEGEGLRVGRVGTLGVGVGLISPSCQDRRAPVRIESELASFVIGSDGSPSGVSILKDAGQEGSRHVQIVGGPGRNFQGGAPELVTSSAQLQEELARRLGSAEMESELFPEL